MDHTEEFIIPDSTEKCVDQKINIPSEIGKTTVKVVINKQIIKIQSNFFHAVCLSCTKLRKLDDTSTKCKTCKNTFQYECLKCRDLLSSEDEFYNHLKVKEFCSDIQVPLFLRNYSYALAIRVKKDQCSKNEWKKVTDFIEIVKAGRSTLKIDKFKRIKLCCPICDDRKPIENGKFWCKKCGTSSVFHCQTCNRNYTTYSSAICHMELLMLKKPIFECNDCSFKNMKKGKLITHIRNNHSEYYEPKENKDKQKVAQCPDCNLIIKSKFYWSKHKNICRKKIYFKCTLCTEKYLVKNDITLHLLVAHQKNDSQISDLMKTIESDRTSQEEKINQKKQQILDSSVNMEQSENNKMRYRSKHYFISYCNRCKMTCELSKITSDSHCPKCKSIVKLQCKFCKRRFSKYTTAYYHVYKSCKKINRHNNQSAQIPKKKGKQKNVKETIVITDDKSNNEYLDNIMVLYYRILK